MHAQEASRESGDIGLLSHQQKSKAKSEDEMMLLKNRKVGTHEIEAQRVRYVRRSRYQSRRLAFAVERAASVTTSARRRLNLGVRRQNAKRS
jgi:hypothetical protein